MIFHELRLLNAKVGDKVKYIAQPEVYAVDEVIDAVHGTATNGLVKTKLYATNDDSLPFYFNDVGISMGGASYHFGTAKSFPTEDMKKIMCSKKIRIIKLPTITKLSIKQRIFSILNREFW